MTSSCRTMGARKEGLPSGRPSPPSPSERRVSSQGWKRLGRECPVPLCSEAPGLHPGAPRHVGDRDGGAGEGAAPVKEVTTQGCTPAENEQARKARGGGRCEGPAGLGAPARPHLPVHLVPVPLGVCRGPRKGGRRTSPGSGGGERVGPPAAPMGEVGTQGDRAQRGWPGGPGSVGCPGKAHLYLSSTCCMPGPVQSPWRALPS